jgi:hypothetical protein
MNKEQLKAKLEALVANEAIKRDELGVAISSAQVAREELANINKPKITEDVAIDLVSNLCRAFNDALGNVDSSDFGIDFSLDYNNTVVVDGISGLDDIDAPEDEFHEILSDAFAIVEDEDEDVYNKP